MRQGLGEDLPRTLRGILRRTVPVWIALMILVGATFGLAYAPLHGWNGAVSLGIAALKALLVALLFMNLLRPDPLLRLVGGAALIWLAFMFALTFADQRARPALSQPQVERGRAGDPPLFQPF